MTDRHLENGHGEHRIPIAVSHNGEDREHLRSKHVQPIAAIFAGSDLDALHMSEGRAAWTDEQWSAHDEKVAQSRALEATEAATRERRNTLAHMSKNGFPQRALEIATSADVTAEAVGFVRNWNHTERSLLVLSGSAGCGKTVAATWWALHRQSTAMFLRATSFASSSRYDHEQRGRWLRAQAMVLDDLGTEYADAKGNFQVDLDELIDTFYGDSKPLIITTNCTADDFKARYGVRVVDRVRECGVWFSMSGKSMRGVK